MRTHHRPQADARDGDGPEQFRRHSVRLSGRTTSVSIEKGFWRELKRIARRDGKSVNRLIAEVDACHKHNRSSTLRVFVLEDVLRHGSGND